MAGKRNPEKLPVALKHREEIIALVRSGVRLQEIAKQFGITPSAISHQLTDDPEYQEAQISWHRERINSAEWLMETAEDQFTLARGEKLWKAYSWRASVEQARIWGQQREAQGATITIDLRGLLEERERRLRTIED